MTSKSFCEDITEGKFSFPIIHTIRSRPDDTQLLNILKKHTDSRPIKEYAIEHMERCGSFAYTKGKLVELHSAVIESIGSMGGHEKLCHLVHYLHKQVLEVKSGGAGVGNDTGNSCSTEILRDIVGWNSAGAAKVTEELPLPPISSEKNMPTAAEFNESQNANTVSTIANIGDMGPPSQMTRVDSLDS